MRLGDIIFAQNGKGLEIMCILCSVGLTSASLFSFHVPHIWLHSEVLPNGCYSLQ